MDSGLSRGASSLLTSISWTCVTCFLQDNSVSRLQLATLFIPLSSKPMKERLQKEIRLFTGIKVNFD